MVTSVGSSMAPTSVEEMPTDIIQVTVYFVPPEVGVSSPHASTASTFSMELWNLGTQRPHYLSFSLPLKEQLFAMPTAMMASLHPSTSIYSENMMAT